MALITSNTTADTAALQNYLLNSNSQGSVPMFGTTSPQRGHYPNDCISLDIYNFTNDYIETVPRITTGYARNGNIIGINIEDTFKNLKYYSGKYNIVAKFYRNYLGSADSDKLVIQEISSDRLEVRVTPVKVETNTGDQFFNFFISGFFNKDKKTVLPNLYLFKDTFTSFKVFDYVQDPFTYPEAPFSIIFKLSAPLPATTQIDDLLWLTQEVSQPISDQITILPPKPELNTTIIAGPNFNILNSRLTNQITDYRDWDDVLSTNTDTSLGVLNKLFSGSLIEGVDLNVDYRRFDNFVHFGSVEERLRNFQYKMELIEYYDSLVYELSQSYATNPSYTANSDITGSAEFRANLLDAKRKKDTLIGAFDSYEKYLYYESSSYVTNSFGEFYPTTWPKSTSSKPYINYPTTASQVTSWFDGIIQSSSLYDLNNQNALRKIIPNHIYVNQEDDQYVLFVDMIGHYFDLIYAYVNQLTTINKRYESLTEGFAKDLVYTIGQSLGLSGENGAVLEELWSYFLGTTVGGDLQSPTYKITVEDRTKEVWKRIIANMPYLLRTKGTARGIRALINCYGIPSTILRVREFGGPEPDYDTTTYEEYDQFYYGLYVSGSRSVSIPTGTGGNALELRFRLHSSSLSQDITYTLMTGPATVTLNPVQGKVVIDGSQTISASLSAVDTDWWVLLLNNSSKAYLGANRYGNALIYSSSGNVTVGSGPAVIPGSSGTKFNGYINEFRIWKTTLNVDTFKKHVLSPTSYQYNAATGYAGSTGSFVNLIVRHTLGADGKKFDASVTTSIASAHPNQSATVTNATLSSFTSDTSSYWIPQVETVYTDVVDGGPTRQVGRKIRIESLVSSSNQALFQGSIVKSLQDLYPVDSPRMGVYFSPTDETNEDINEQFGGYNLDDFIGDPADYYEGAYTGLDVIKNEYFKKYRKRNDAQGFIRLVQNYDTSLFQLVKQFVPERAVLHTGVVVESHVLHRNKVANKKPSWENLYHTSSVEIQNTPGGETQYIAGATDVATTTLNGTSNYYETVSTNANATVTDTSGNYIADINQLDGDVEVYQTPSYADRLEIVELDSFANQYNNDQLNFVEGVSDTGYAQPAIYNYRSWFRTGSTLVYNLSVSQDIWDPIQPIILDNTPSSVYERSVDRFNNVMTTEYLSAYMSYNGDENTLLRLYGLMSGSNDISASIVSLNDEYVVRLITNTLTGGGTGS